MVPWAEAPVPILTGIHTSITGIDETPAHRGQLGMRLLAARHRP